MSIKVKVFILSLLLTGCGLASKSKDCSIKCGVAKGLEISKTGDSANDHACHCKTDKGWEIKE